MVVIVGLTGGIACGKSTVSGMLKEKGAVIVDADRVSHEVMAAGTPLARRVVEAFKDDPGVRVADAAVDRDALGDVVFKDPAKRRKLGQLTQGPIFWGLVTQLWRAWISGTSRTVVVLDLPLLLETKVFTYICEAVFVVAVPEDMQRERLVKRNGYTKEQADSRLAAQMPTSEKVKHATHVIDNAGSLEQTRETVSRLMADVRSNARILSPLRKIQATLVAATALLALLLSSRFALF
eukprot:TRINITY_DN24933_c0_g1_i1.p1 TRINITY_DN24933_c0_g1~~TRINITY_DN24933_c0_g1_i1.p1  ORF type:complete len:262 (+),score=97.25 TRINITY_DN24933_c0_g1_i1:77-787(+)